MLGVLFYFTEHTRKLIILTQVIIIGILMILSLVIPDRLLFGTNESIYLRDLPGGDISLISRGFTWWRGLTNLTVLSFVFSAIFLIIKKIDYISYKTVIIFFAGLGLILLAGMYDHMVELDRLNPVYMLPFSVFLFYIILNFIPYVFLLKDVFENSRVYEEEKKWRKLVDEAAVIVVELNRMGLVVFINKYFYELTGYKEDEVIGKEWFEIFIPRKQHYELQSAFIEILEFEFHPQYLNPILTKNKEEKMIHWFNVRSRDKNGTITGSLSIGVDITEDFSQKEELVRKLAEAEAIIGKFKAGARES
jgi:PAS domain S-box-containing protein